ncbi:hypothetical protein M422DRAFT_120675, partial [Sphaerobolus stellatus SS14]
LSLLASAFALANGHFLLNYPPTRGFDEDKVRSCIVRGFSSNGTRNPFPLTDGWVSITSEHPKSFFIVVVSFDEDPTTFSEFNTTSNGTKIPPLEPFTNLFSTGDACVPVNVGATGFAKNGTNATILVQFDGGDGDLFQCSDIVLLDNVKLPSDAKCSNTTNIFT